MPFRWLTWRRFLLLVLLAAVGFAATVVVLLPKRTGVEGWRLVAEPRPTVGITDARLRELFRSADPPPTRQAYESLVLYFLEGWLNYRSTDSERAYYPGAGSQSGRRIDGLEAYARILPVAAAWLASDRPAIVQTAAGPVDLVDVLARGLAAGTDPNHPGYWGPITDYSQHLVESADIALGVWLARESIWQRLDAPQRARVIEWLTGALRSEAFEGNWQMFPMIVHHALQGLGADVARWTPRIQSNWEYFKASFHRGRGWFFDPPHGFDYYNAWSIHYALFWLQRMDPTFERPFIAAAQADFVGFYKHLFGPQGHPLYGRSACYRMAAPLPLLTAQATAPASISKGEAMRALDLTWSLFIARGAASDGRVTQGFCGTDLSIVQPYTGPASCLWALRSLVVAFTLDRDLGLFDSPRSPLPVERGDFSITNPSTGWIVAGTQSDGRVALTIPSNPEGDGPDLVPYGTMHRAIEWLTHKPRRPDNSAALYGRRTYVSGAPLVPCEAPTR